MSQISQHHAWLRSCTVRLSVADRSGDWVAGGRSPRKSGVGGLLQDAGRFFKKDSKEDSKEGKKGGFLDGLPTPRSARQFEIIDGGRDSVSDCTKNSV